MFGFEKGLLQISPNGSNKSNIASLKQKTPGEKRQDFGRIVFLPYRKNVRKKYIPTQQAEKNYWKKI